MSIMGTFRFHNVGQGLFYTGILDREEDSNHEVFSFVYDCGTESKQIFLEQEIDNYAQLLSFIRGENIPVLDLLIISHLHDDHVSGLEKLLERVKVRSVVMPYVYINSELLQAAKIGSRYVKDFLGDFFDDPINWLGERGAETILLIGAYDKPDDEFNNENSRSTPEEGASPFEMNGMSISPRPHNTSGNTRNNRCGVMRLFNHTDMTLTGFSWSFHFGYLPVNKIELISYLNNVVKALKVKSLDSILNKSTLINLRKNGNKEIFKGGNKAVNRTSIVVSHKPIVDKIASAPYYYETLLAGDIELDPGKPAGKKSPAVPREPMPIIDNCAGMDIPIILQYPHHGGKNDINRFVNLGAEFNIVSFGIGNRHFHPCSEIVSLPNHLWLVHQRSAFEYTITV